MYNYFMLIGIIKNIILQQDVIEELIVELEVKENFTDKGMTFYIYFSKEDFNYILKKDIIGKRVGIRGRLYQRNLIELVGTKIEFLEKGLEGLKD